jgi:hypothetical protein
MLILLAGNFGTVFVDQSYWQSAIAAKPSSSTRGYLLGGLVWFTIPFALATSMVWQCRLTPVRPRVERIWFQRSLVSPHLLHLLLLPLLLLPLLHLLLHLLLLLFLPLPLLLVLLLLLLKLKYGELRSNFAFNFNLCHYAKGLATVALDLPVTGDEAGQGLVPPAAAVHFAGKGGAAAITIMLFMVGTDT